jgi:hypothetical protein
MSQYIDMSQYIEPEPHRPADAPTTRPPWATSLISLCVAAAVIAGAALLIRIMSVHWPLWVAGPLGALLGFVLVATFIVVVGRSTARIVVASVLVLIAVALLWSTPSHLPASWHRHPARAAR